MSRGALVGQADTFALPLPDESVDLIVTSPPYFGQRSYKDGDEHYDGQLGSEPSPQEWLANLWRATSEWWRVLKPEGSCFVNLGDKRAGSGAPGTTSGLGIAPQGERSGITGSFGQHRLARGEERNLRTYGMAEFGRKKSKMLLPHRYAIGCEDGSADPEGVGWVMRQDLVWWKKNGLPESVRDRMRDQHEYVFHLTKNGDYYAAMDELREEHADPTRDGTWNGARGEERTDGVSRDRGWQAGELHYNPLGRLPGSVIHIANEPLLVPDWLGVDHFAAFPTEIPRRLILGFSPPAICCECGKGRWPVVDVEHEPYRAGPSTGRPHKQDATTIGGGWNNEGYLQTATRATITGYACACTPYTDHEGTGERHPNTPPEGRHGNTEQPHQPGGVLAAAERTGPWREYHLTGWTPPPSRPAVVLDPFGGTGTTAMVARALGRLGVSFDLSWDYSRLARWRVWDSGHAAKVVARRDAELQGTLL